MSERPKQQATARRSIFGAAAGALAATGMAASPALAQGSGGSDPLAQPTRELVDRIIRDWPQTATQAARTMLDKYGPPAEATPTRLIWFNNGPWKRTTVLKEEIDHDFPMPHKDVLEQVINYEVAPDKMDELAAYDGSVIVERTRGEMSARCDKEAANILALNLAHDIVRGNKSVDEARRAYGEAMKAVMAGNPPEITQRLTFQPPQTAGFSDQPILETGSGSSKQQPNLQQRR
ncbi:MAG TPA: hypothetical protein VGN83_24330 [Falsiroseomonas sp.]|nr:hypothetical protein [Falsiroseomonas sp.]